MTSGRPLSAAFLEAARGSIAAAAPPPAPPARSTPLDAGALEGQLEQALARGAAAHPALGVAPVAFAAYVGARVPADGLAQASAEDLFLACACLAGAPGAVARADAALFPAVAAALGRAGIPGAQIDEVTQAVRALVFTGTGATDGRPRLGEYRGVGPLVAWLRVTALRAAVKLQKRAQREVGGSDDALLGVRAGDDDPELAYMKASYRAAFREAFQEALDSLEPKDRALLKQQVVDGLTVDELGALWQVHRATAARWVASARELLLSRTRRAFKERLKLPAEECESIMRLVQSQLDVSLHRRLAHA